MPDAAERRPSQDGALTDGLTTNEEFRIFFEMAGVGNAVVDVVTQRFVQVNRRFEEITGYSANELCALTFADITHADDRGVSDAHFRELISGQLASSQMEKRYVRKDGRIVWVLLTTTIVRDAIGAARFQVGVVNDISAQHEARSQLAELHERLHALVQERTAALANKTAQLENFIYTVGHNLRAPLRAINGYAEFINEDEGVRLTPESVGHLDQIKKAAHRLDGLIQDLLSYTRAVDVALRIDQVALEPVVARVLVNLRGEIEARHAEVTIETPLPVVRGEQISLEQVITHLLANALKFVATGEQPKIRIHTEVKKNVVRCCITDNGIGIAGEFHHRVFRMFERLEDARGYPGTGVGLPIVSKTIERLGGTVGLQSSVGQGSTFWFELPRPSS